MSRNLRVLRHVECWEFACRCARCGYRWTVITPEPPVRCAKCRRVNWQRPARAYRISLTPDRATAHIETKETR